MKNFLNYYHDELLSLREKGGIFAKKHPDIAEKLDIKNGESSDPQTERIIESVAYMAAKLHQKIDSNAQNIAFFLLSALYPNLITVFPPCGIAKFEDENIASNPDKLLIKKGTSLFINSKNNIECQFKTLYPITLYPLSITNVQLLKTGRKIGGLDGWSLEISIMTKSVPIELLGTSDLLFYINFDIIEDSLAVYESIFSDPKRNVFLRINEKFIKIDNSKIIPCGFQKEESVSPVPDYSTNSFQLFQELLYFKQKFMFFRIIGIDDLIKNSGISNIHDFSISIDVNVSNERLVEIINNNSILLNAVPIVNLFPVTSDPFRFDGTKTKYLLLADQTRDKSIEIHSISEIHTINTETQKDYSIQPYFFLSTDSDTNTLHDLYWVFSRESSTLRNLDGFDTYISFIDTKMNPYKSYSDIVYAKLLCTNRFETRDIPIFSKMYIDNLESGGYYAKLISKLTKPINFSEENCDLWNLIQQLTTNHISFSTLNNMIDHLKSIFNIFAVDSKLKAEELFNGIDHISVKEIIRRFGKDAWRGFVKGLEITVEVSEKYNQFNYLLTCILNQYLSDIISINSFVELKILSPITHEIKAYWPPISGKQNLI